MDDYLKTDMTEFGLMLKSINPSVEWIAIPPEVKWVDAGCSMNQLSALKYVEVQDVYVLLSIMYPQFIQILKKLMELCIRKIKKLLLLALCPRNMLKFWMEQR